MEIIYKMLEPIDGAVIALSLLVGVIGLGGFIAAVVCIASGDRDKDSWVLFVAGLCLSGMSILSIVSECNTRKELVFARIAPETAYVELAPEWEYIENEGDIYTLVKRVNN
jgi:hypothetical protein